MVTLLRERLHAGPHISAEARSALAPLERKLRPQLYADLRLLVSELVTNSFRHAGLGSDDPVDLCIASGGGRIRVEVEDPGGGFSALHPVPARDVSESGWGLTIVEALSDRWGVVRDGSTLVWFELVMEGSRVGSER